MQKTILADPQLSALRISGNKNQVELKEPSPSTATFGIHLTIDGYGGDVDLLNDMAVVHNVLNDLPERIRMHKIMPPYVVFAPPISEKDSGGYSGFVMIAESHISVHTFARKKYVSIDVYTCKNKLPVKFVVDYFKQAFKLEEVEVHTIRRGKKFPTHDLV